MAKPPEPERSVHAGTSDIELVNEAHRLAEGNGLHPVLMARQMAMNHRVIVALEKFNESSDRWAKRLVALTIMLIVFTVVLVVLTGALLQRGG